ncbi:hypothetical protein NA57DRAFT_22489, partial [Rhizodiscina lignyota]
LPRVAQPSLWESLIPKALRKRPADQKPNQSVLNNARKNPATPFILLGLLCGSQAIHTIRIKGEIAAYSRKTDAKIHQLRTVIEKVQAGQIVDVEKELGTGDPNSEREWREVIEEIEKENPLWQGKRQKKKRKE